MVCGLVILASLQRHSNMVAWAFVSESTVGQDSGNSVAISILSNDGYNITDTLVIHLDSWGGRDVSMVKRKDKTSEGLHIVQRYPSLNPAEQRAMRSPQDADL